jgi:hypothetical protein
MEPFPCNYTNFKVPDPPTSLPGADEAQKELFKNIKKFHIKEVKKTGKSIFETDLEQIKFDEEEAKEILLEF